MPDKFSMSGDFRGAFINIKSTLTNVQQSIGDISTDDLEAKRELEKLIEQLNEALQKAPVEKQDDAQAVAETVRALVDVAKSEKPNRTMLQITSDGLKRAAQNLAETMPVVVTLTSQIALAVSNLLRQ